MGNSTPPKRRIGKDLNYRKDIQILRGVAVLLVVLFHLGVTQFSSGFLGVDVFFVISGYLMAVMYNPSKKAEFFAKRASRLLPAYFATIVVTVLVSAILTTPNDYSQVRTSAIFASLFASNIGFWLESSYFDKGYFRPLLHLWSLGVEIQFYLIVPLLVASFRKFRWSFFAIAIASAVLCFLAVKFSPRTPFFWMPFRLWEFLLGFGIGSYLASNSFASRKSPWLGTIGLAVVIGIPLMKINGGGVGFIQGHPGLVALLICLATSLVLLFGLPAKILETRISTALEKLGGYSYSIYLAHFPVIALYLYRPFSGTVLAFENSVNLVIGVLLVAVTSTLLYVVVEKPARHRLFNAPRYAFAFMAILCASWIGLVIQRHAIDAKEMIIYEAWQDRAPYRCGNLLRITNPGAISCDLTPEIRNPKHSIFLVGNSHADAIKNSFAAAAKSKNVRVWFLMENIPLMTGGISPESLIKEAKSKKVEGIVLHYASKTLPTEALIRLSELAKKEGISLDLIMPVPVWPDLVPLLLINQHRGHSIPDLDIDAYIKQNSELNIAIQKSTAVRVHQTVEVFCNPRCVAAASDGRPLYFDSNHLTLTGARRLETVFAQVVDGYTQQDPKALP